MDLERGTLTGWHLGLTSFTTSWRNRRKGQKGHTGQENKQRFSEHACCRIKIGMGRLAYNHVIWNWVLCISYHIKKHFLTARVLIGQRSRATSTKSQTRPCLFFLFPWLEMLLSWRSPLPSSALTESPWRMFIPEPEFLIPCLPPASFTCTSSCIQDLRSSRAFCEGFVWRSMRY